MLQLNSQMSPASLSNYRYARFGQDEALNSISNTLPTTLTLVSTHRLCSLPLQHKRTGLLSMQSRAVCTLLPKAGSLPKSNLLP